MICKGFSLEQYALFALGSLEAEEASEIAAHLALHCERCVREIQGNLQFWSAFGAAIAPEAEAPRRRDWTGIVGPAKPSRVSFFDRRQWAALAAGLLIAASTGFWFSVFQQAPERARLERQLGEARQGQARAIAERDNAMARARSEQRTPAGPAAGAPPDTGLAAAQRAVRTAQQQSRAVGQQLTEAQQAVADARAQIAQLQVQAGREQTELARLRSEDEGLRAAAQAAQASQLSASARIQSLEQQIRVLETERGRLQDVIGQREQEQTQGLRANAYLTQPGTRVIEVRGTQSAPGASATVLLTRDNRLLFIERGLAPAASGRAYQLWLVRRRGEPIVSGGLFTSAGSAAQIEVNQAALLEGLTGVAVTDEPAKGSRLPTGHKLLIGTIRG